jgi:RNA polymerase sigma-70 factor (ECF subfamily)
MAASGSHDSPAFGDGQGLDQTLLLAAQGDQDAWRCLVEAYTRRVYGLLVRQCGDRDLAEEITQSTFVKVVTKLGDTEGYEERGKFEAWLFRIAMNQLRDEMRRRKRQARPMDMTPGTGRSGEDGRDDPSQWAAAQDRITQRRPADWPDPTDAASTAEQVALLREAIATMTPADQEILYLRHTAGLSFAQIAQTLGQPLGTVLARGHRALGKLRQLLVKEDEDPAGTRINKPA